MKKCLSQDLLNVYDGNQIRLALLSTHYRQPIPWNKTLLEQAKTVSKKINKFTKDLNLTPKFNVDTLIAQDLLDDLNTPKAIATIQKLIQSPTDNIESELETFQYIFEGSKHKVRLYDNKISEIEKLIKERDIARKNGNYDQADEIRDKLTKMNVITEDVNGKTEWKI